MLGRLPSYERHTLIFPRFYIITGPTFHRDRRQEKLIDRDQDSERFRIEIGGTDADLSKLDLITAVLDERYS